MFAQFRSSYVGGLAQFRSSYVDESAQQAITVVTDIESGNVKPSSVIITDATTATPTIYCDARIATSTTDWRHFLFAVENAEGKTPLFKFNRATKITPATAPLFRPYWTQDFVTWTQAPSRTLVGGSSGTIEWQFAEPLPAGRVYIASHPMWRLAEISAFVSDMLTNHADVWSPTGSADASGVYTTSTAETDDLGRQVGLNPMYAIKASWPVPTTDGGPKRKLLMTSGEHAAGEAPSMVMGKYFLDWMMFDASPEAQALRANWDLYWYGALSPNGLKGGAPRQSYVGDVGLSWPAAPSVSPLAYIAATQTAILTDTGGAVDVMFGWHSYAARNETFIVGMAIEDQSSPSPAFTQMLSSGTTTFGVAPTLITGTVGTPTLIRWARDSLSAKISIDPELGQNANLTLADYKSFGESWAKTLQAVDAAGHFYIPPPRVLRITNLHPSADGATNVRGVVFSEPTGGNLVGSIIGEFTGKTVSGGTLDVALTDFGGESLAVGALPRVYLENTIDSTPIFVAEVLEE